MNLASDASASAQRLYLEQLVHPTLPPRPDQGWGQDVVTGLSQTPKTLSPKYFYDDRGSELFEQICQLPEYYLTRTETAILQQFGPAIAQLTGPCELVELGSGSATKTRILLDAYGASGSPLRYLPIDVSGGMLKQSALDLLSRYPTLEIHGLIATYETGLQQLPSRQLPTRMICFLGSTLGNLNPPECQQFFAQVRSGLQPGEYFLLGIDLQKPIPQLEAAYNDSQGVTAAFNLNLLSHLNWRFQGNFDLKQFEHWAFYNESQHQIEMHLRSLIDQTVTLAALDFAVPFQAGETIFTEISRKFDLSQIQPELRSHGLAPCQVWTDPEQQFGLILCQQL